MVLKPVSLRIGLVLALLLIGATALGLAYIGAGLYHEQTREERATALMTELARESGVSRREIAAESVTNEMRRQAQHAARVWDEQFERHRLAALLIAAISLVVICYVVLLAFDRGVSTPLHILNARLRSIAAGHDNTTSALPATAPAELHELNDGLGAVTEHLHGINLSLARAAFTDVLTGLPNRALFQDRLQQMILTAAREPRPKPFALMLMDLDQFKDINDTLGHPMGDAVLRQVAERLRGKLRESDTVARLGGDEYAVLLPGADERQAAMAARMLLQSLRVPLPVEGYNLDIAASIGIAVYPDHGVDGDTLMQRADVAMYSVKGTGHGFAFYHTGLDERRGERLALMADLRRAIEQEQFELYYQPKVDVATGHVMGVEALMRWRHPRDGLVMPDMFIPLLERTGQIRSLTPWLLSEAMAMSRRLQEQGVSVIMAVNLSVADLQDPQLAESAREQLDAHGVDASMIEFEITESGVMNDPQSALVALTRLAEMGFQLAIDDFGTGYSSFVYLKKMPINVLKIDKSFVLGMGSDENDLAIVRTSIDLAHNLGLKIVAEGVESEEDFDRLRALGCDTAQGYYISRPLPATELVDWLQRSNWGAAEPFSLRARFG